MFFKKYLVFYLNHLFRFLGVIFTSQIAISLTFNYPLTKISFTVAIVCGLIYASSKRNDFFKKDN